MASSVPDLMARLRQSSARLNQLSDEAATTVKAIEVFLGKECSNGIECDVVVEFGECDEDDHHAKISLGYYKWRGDFRIVVIDELDDQPSIKPWADSRRDLKVKTIAFLPKLLEAISQTTESMIAESESALTEVKVQIGAIPRPQQTSEEVPF